MRFPVLCQGVEHFLLSDVLRGKLSQTSLPRAAVNFVPALQGVLAEWVHHVAQGMRQPKTQCHMRCPCGAVKGARLPRRVTHEQDHVRAACKKKELWFDEAVGRAPSGLGLA